ncbi:hypothetical protein QBC45DRAFT_421209 [Copromyces sp. CBS 386.78]|nr:hypothetical protein QBC45DRAFT_421209 [Copromyces sp. CBS 386.78]
MISQLFPPASAPVAVGSGLPLLCLCVPALSAWEHVTNMEGQEEQGFFLAQLVRGRSAGLAPVISSIHSTCMVLARWSHVNKDSNENASRMIFEQFK